MDEEICDQFQQFVWDEITRQGLFGLATADIEFNKKFNIVELTGLSVDQDHRGLGYGRKVMNIITNAADRLHTNVCLVPSAMSGSMFSDDALSSWYGRCGFEPFFEKFMIYVSKNG